MKGKPFERDETSEEIDWARERDGMVEDLRRHGIRDERILLAMGRIRRHLFIPEPFRRHGEAYGDHPCSIGFGQTISQPFIVAYMTGKLALKPGETVLEIGVGSGYQAAVLAELGVRVYSVEIVPELARHARAVLDQEGYAARILLLTGDGYRGWPEKAPFDAILVTCAPAEVPVELVNQLKEGGRCMLPIGEWNAQQLALLRKTDGRIIRLDDLPVRFVPMVKKEGRPV